jgi:hypothetical protein
VLNLGATAMAVAFLLAGCDGGNDSSEPRPSPTQSSTASPSELRVQEHVCDDYGYTPREVLVACGDGNVRVESLRWETWTASRAVGAGEWQQNDCMPDCATGTFHRYPVRLSLSEPMDRDGHRIFGTVVADFPGAKPPYAGAASGHEVLMSHGCRVGQVCS